jgi:hypothetical protein
MISLDNCPICGGHWKPSEKLKANGEPRHNHECVKCFARYFPNKFFSRGNVLGKKDYFIGWDLRNHICEYGNLLDAVDGKLTKLPWLDFNITSEKLKLYILFS